MMEFVVHKMPICNKACSLRDENKVSCSRNQLTPLVGSELTPGRYPLISSQTR